MSSNEINDELEKCTPCALSVAIEGGKELCEKAKIKRKLNTLGVTCEDLAESAANEEISVNQLLDIFGLLTGDEGVEKIRQKMYEESEGDIDT